MLPVVIGAVLGLLAVVAVANLAMAAVMLLTVRLAAGFRPGYLRSYLVSLAAFAAALLAPVAIGAAGLVGLAGSAGPLLVPALAMAVQIPLYGALIAGPAGRRLGLLRAVPVAAVQTALLAAFLAALSSDPVSTHPG